MDVAQGLGSRFRKLNNQPSAFARWQKYSFRKMLPPVERDELRSMPKLWKMGGVTSLTLKPGENTELPPLLRTMQTSAACLALQGRAGRDSPMHALPADLVQQICESVPEIHLQGGTGLETCRMLKFYRELQGEGLIAPTPERDSADSIKLKKQAGDVFAQQKYTAAANLYAEALGALPRDDAALQVILNSNVAECCLRIEKWFLAAHYATRALAEEPDHAKSLRRLAAAAEHLSENELAGIAARNNNDDDTADDLGLGDDGEASPDEEDEERANLRAFILEQSIQLQIDTAHIK